MPRGKCRQMLMCAMRHCSRGRKFLGLLMHSGIASGAFSVLGQRTARISTLGQNIMSRLWHVGVGAGPCTRPSPAGGGGGSGQAVTRPRAGRPRLDRKRIRTPADRRIGARQRRALARIGGRVGPRAAESIAGGMLSAMRGTGGGGEGRRAHRLAGSRGGEGRGGGRA